MIITNQRPLDEILKVLEGKTKIFLVGCADCSTTCKTGGEPEILKMTEELKKNGKEIIGGMCIDVPCSSSAVKKDLAKFRKDLRGADAVLSFSCGAGVQSIKENARLDIPVYAGCDTMFYGVIDADGNFQEKCMACGDCILELTGGICPITRCAKSLMSGPCGGTSALGKCEVDAEQDCAWALIYQEMKKTGTLDKLKPIHEPKDYSKMYHPRKKINNPIVKSSQADSKT